MKRLMTGMIMGKLAWEGMALSICRYTEVPISLLEHQNHCSEQTLLAGRQSGRVNWVKFIGSQLKIH